jgi:hypothetical protein
MDQLLDNIPQAQHTRQNDEYLLFSIGFPMVLSGIVAAAMSALPSPGPRIHPNPAARKRSLVGRGLQALACGDWDRVQHFTRQLEREGLTDA